MAQRKCVICGNLILPTDETIPYKNRLAHITCFNNMSKIAGEERKQREKKPARKPVKKKVASIELKEQVSEEEHAQKTQFFQFLRELLNEQELSAKIYKLTSDYLKQYPDFTYESMYQALYYYYIIQGHPAVGDCVGIIPYCHEDAKRYYKSIQNIEKENDGIDPANMYQTKTYRYVPHVKKKPLIDITTIVEGSK